MTNTMPASSSPHADDVDGDAPVVARAHVEILAQPELVFAVITDIATWPNWNPAVQSVSIDGEVVAGTRFRWKAGPSTIVSTVEEVQAPRRIVWTGRTFGIRAVHVYELVPQGDRTLVVTRESWRGALVRLFPERLTRALARSLESGLEALRAEAEKRALTGGRPR